MEQITKTKIKLWVGGIASWLIFSLSLLLILFMIITGIFTKGYSYAWNRFLHNNIYKDAHNALYGYCWDYYNTIRRNETFETHYYDQLYSEENSNFRFTCVSEEGTAIPGYFNIEEKKQISKEYNFTLSFYEDSDTHKYYYRDEESMYEFLSSLDGDFSYDIEENVSENNEISYYVTVYRNIEQNFNVKMQVYVPTELKATDKYYYANSFFHVLNNTKLYIVITMTVSAICMVIFSIMLVNRAGRKNDSKKISLNQIDRLPYEIPLAFLGATVFFSGWASYKMFVDYPNNLLSYIIYCIVICFGLIVIGAILLEFVLTTAVRIKVGQLVSNTIVYKIISFVFGTCRKFWRALTKIGSYKKTAFIFIVLDAMLFFLFTYVEQYSYRYYSDFSLVLFYVVLLVLFLFEITVVYNVYLLQTSCKRISEGELDYKIDNKYILRHFSEVSDSINSISEGMNHALRDQIKSEHFKTELITNVSHDIKTPLTSIITYVNLLQQSEVSGEDATEYLDVLERQSEKLKKLIEDLVEASKASTGNLNLDCTVMDIGVLVEQAVGEYEEKFSVANLNVVMEKEPENFYISADGGYLWRVIDNLLSNICKYSMENTRVYITVKKNDRSQCLITFKNISKYEIKITPEELTERFVRGDKSRNTEGSGLGLSIARSLTEAMGGKLYIEVDGDLYKAVLVFDCVQ